MDINSQYQHHQQEEIAYDDNGWRENEKSEALSQAKALAKFCLRYMLLLIFVIVYMEPAKSFDRTHDPSQWVL